MSWVIGAIWVAALLPYLFVLLSGIPAQGAFSRWGPGYSNTDARASLDKLEGWRRRAHYAQQNGYEAFAPFAIAVFLAHSAQVDVARWVPIAVTFLACRLAYGFFYMAGSGAGRSAAWWAGFACVCGLFGLSLAASLKAG